MDFFVKYNTLFRSNQCITPGGIVEVAGAGAFLKLIRTLQWTRFV